MTRRSQLRSVTVEEVEEGEEVEEVEVGRPQGSALTAR